MYILSGHRRSFLHDDFFFPPVNIYAKMLKANSMNNFTNSITTLNIVPGNSRGRSCHTIRAETIKAPMRMTIRFRFIVYLPADTTHAFIISHHFPASDFPRMKAPRLPASSDFFGSRNPDNRVRPAARLV
jgi:hypothetical protein